MKTDFPYQPEMLQSDMYLTFDARIGKKAVEVPAVKVATGVIATSELYHQTLVGASPVLAPDAFQRITQVKQEANIKFLVAQTQLRKSELQNNSVKEFINLLQRINNERETLSLTNVEVSAYASPEGSLSLNERLASGRQDVSAEYVEQQLKRTRLNAPVDTRYTAEDWEGFQQLVRASDIQDKDVILRVLSMYEDPEEREQQIRNMSEAFRELADGILPELRRARLIANYEVIGRDDQQILQQFRDDASQLSIEELLYAAALVNNADEKMAIYQRATQLFPNDARAYNNIGRLYYQQHSYDQAKQYFQRTLSIDSNNNEAYANLGLLELLNGNIADAETFIGRASGSDNIAEVWVICIWHRATMYWQNRTLQMSAATAPHSYRFSTRTTPRQSRRWVGLPTKTPSPIICVPCSMPVRVTTASPAHSCAAPLKKTPRCRPMPLVTWS